MHWSHRRRRPLSITLRLALLFASIAVLTFVAVGAYLYQTLASQMSYRDDLELIGKVTQIRHVLGELPSLQAVGQGPRALLDTLFGQDDFVLRVSAPDGAPLLQTAPASRPLPAGDSVPARRKPTVADVRDWTPAAGSGRMLSADGLVGTHHGAAGQPVRITLARERSDRLKMLRRYASDLLWALCIGAALATALGFVIARYSIRQLRSVAGKANDISTNRLNTRLSVRDAPVELRELGLAFNAMLDRLEDGVQRLSGFAADLAHDLRTPLNTLMLETQVALSHPRSNEEYQALLVSNAEEYERLARMIENTLFLARVDNARMALQRERLELDGELRRIHDYFEMLADDAGVRLIVEASAIVLHVDPVLLQRAVGNLVSNAIRHTPRGGAVSLSARRVGNGVELAVSNSGAGIAAVHLPHIFDRYYRADPARGAASSSAGLGLAIVRAIMTLHGGTVRADSPPGGGTTFFLLFKDA
ncbi:heavy metal sensor histidine kinase [Janthinobacterium agaricidamnosum]|uniref:Sensor protein n=1 Tax=Janthinobacterium agaricidamnosum NBRC 102515 = DSM 9628 TaxID=1349767 RepID=W0V8G1_9BURK|nr:heavy metal sensor histidine kinase [Janthinobacterium agaricidamnosum]CDG83633.1 heavy metal sensor kinase family protein [Janthinobacterium agaricidamnosum NBRC 102515 = DSM 9628]